MRTIPILAALAIAPALAGCSGYPSSVAGTVKLDDGTPVTKGLVVFAGAGEANAVSARGLIQPDGTYRLGTDKPDDGVPPGRYRVLVNPLDDSDLAAEKKNLPYDVKYLRFQTSGIECDVPRGAVDFPITLTRPTKPSR